MEKLEGILPGISKYLNETLANERLSPAAERQRRHFIELLDVLNLRAPPRVPAPLPTSGVATSRAAAPLPPAPGFGKQNSVQDSIPAWKLADASFANSSAAEASAKGNGGQDEVVYNVVIDETMDGSAGPARKHSSDASTAEGDGTYEEPVNILSPAKKQNVPAADNAGGTTEGSGTDYEEYSSDDDGDYEDGELPLAEASTEVETILLPRVKSKKKKKGPPAGYLKPYDALTSRQYEGEAFVRRNISWSRFFCVLAQNALYCYKTPADLQPRVFVLLDGHDVLLMDKEKGRNNVLRISKPGTETLFLSCDTIERANEWFKQLTVAVARPDNRTSADEKATAMFYYGHDQSSSAPSAASASQIPVQTTRQASDDGDYRPYSPGPSGAATLPLSALHATKSFVPESATVPKAAPRKTVAADGKKKSRITNFFGTGGKKKGRRVTMGLMQDYSSKQLSTDPDVVISGMLAVSSHNFGSSGRRWEEARCLIRAAGTFECQCLGSYEGSDAASSSADSSLSLGLAECTMEPSSDKDRPLAVRLMRAGSLELTFMPCDRLEHGNWLAALCKYVDRGGTKAAAAAGGVGTAAAAVHNPSSGSSSTSGSGDGVIQHSSYINLGPTAAAAVDRAASHSTNSADRAAAAGDQTAGAAAPLPPIYINVDGSEPKPAIPAPSHSGASDDENYEDVDKALADLRQAQQAAVRRSAETLGVAAAVAGVAAAVPTAAGRPGAAAAAPVSPASTAGSTAPASPSSSGTAGQEWHGAPTTTAEEGGSAEDSVSVLVRILNAEASMSRSSAVAVTTPAAARLREATPPPAAAATITVAAVAADRLRPAAAAAAASASSGPAARQQPSLSAGTPPPAAVNCAAAAAPGSVLPVARDRAAQQQQRAEPTKAIASAAAATAPAASASSLSPPLASSGSTSPSAGAAASETATDFAPKKLTVSGGIARNRALFEGPAAAAATAAGGAPSGKATSATLAPEARWSGYKLAVAPAVAAGSASPGLGHSRRRSSSDLEVSPLPATAAAATASGNCSAPPRAAPASTAASGAAAVTAAASAQTGQGSAAKAGFGGGTFTASVAVVGLPAPHQAPQPRPPPEPVGGTFRSSAAMPGKAAATVTLPDGCTASHGSTVPRDGPSPPVDGGTAVIDASSSKVDVTKKTEARIFLGSMVGKLAVPTAAAAGAATAASSEQPALAPTAAVSIDVRLESGDAKQQLEQHRLHLAELRKQRNQVRAQKASAAVAERSRLEVEYRMLDDRCRELERLINDLEDVNLMHIKGQAKLV